jgi:O-methyltransferase
MNEPDGDLRDLSEFLRTPPRSEDPAEHTWAGFRLLQRLAARLVPGYIVTYHSKSWFADEAFLVDYDRLIPGGDRRSADRRFFLRSILSLANVVPGDTAECGGWTGASSWFICRHFAGTGRHHHVFDSFEGLSEPTPVDGNYWRSGDYKTSEDTVRETLDGFDVILHPGWIPERFVEVEDRSFSFVHIDVDLHEPTRDSIAFFYPRISPGGLLLLDDYGFQSCPGAMKAVDEFMADKPEPVVHVPTGQAFIIKR